MDKKTKALYLGLDPTHFKCEKTLVHFPLIEIQPRSFEELLPSFKNHEKWSHIVLTSRSAVDIFFHCCYHWNIDCSQKEFLLVGTKTASQLDEKGVFQKKIASDECAEGVVALLQHIATTHTFLFYPHSSGARSVIDQFLANKGCKFISCSLYDTYVKKHAVVPSIAEFDELIFTSPSVVAAFYETFGSFPKDKIYTTVGKITEKKLAEFLKIE